MEDVAPTGRSATTPHVSVSKGHHGADQRTDPRLVFVGGPPRSGTTLLQNMLDSHSDGIGLPEFMVLPEIMQLRTQLHDLVDRGWIEAICSKRDIDLSISDLVRRLLTANVDHATPVFIAEKTPENCLAFLDIAEVFPQAKLVALIRDPRGIVASLLQVGKRAERRSHQPPVHTLSLVEAICRTRDCIRATLAASASLGDRLHIISYEDLVTRPDEEMRRLTDFLEVPFSTDMLRPSDQEHPGKEAITDLGIWYRPDDFNRDPDPSVAGRWRQRLSPFQQAVTAAAFASCSVGREMGYDLSLSEYPAMLRRAAPIMARFIDVYDDRIRNSPLHGIAARLIRLRSRMRRT